MATWTRKIRKEYLFTFPILLVRDTITTSIDNEIEESVPILFSFPTCWRYRDDSNWQKKGKCTHSLFLSHLSVTTTAIEEKGMDVHQLVPFSHLIQPQQWRTNNMNEHKFPFPILHVGDHHSNGGQKVERDAHALHVAGVRSRVGRAHEYLQQQIQIEPIMKCFQLPNTSKDYPISI